MVKNLFIILTLLLVQSCGGTEIKDVVPNEFTAKVIGVKDGDTIEVLYNNTPIVIRLEHIDCPEKKQPFGNRAKQFVSDYIFGKNAKIISKGKKDRWGRLLAVVLNEKGDNLNKALVINGLAMHYKKYSKDMSYDELEIIAKTSMTGMWSQPNLIEPWVFRKQKKSK